MVIVFVEMMPRIVEPSESELSILLPSIWSQSLPNPVTPSSWIEQPFMTALLVSYSRSVPTYAHDQSPLRSAHRVALRSEVVDRSAEADPM